MEKINLNEYLASNEYPGRGIAVAMAPDGRQMFIEMCIRDRPYTAHEYAHEEGVAVAGVDVAGSMGEDPACVYNTLVTQGNSNNYFVFVIPVAAELDLKAAARSVCLLYTSRCV